MHVNLTNDTKEYFEPDGTILELVSAETNLGVYHINSNCNSNSNTLLTTLSKRRISTLVFAKVQFL